MKRDLDLCRRLLADIEAHGPECPINALGPGASLGAEETVLYHVRLLIDAGLLKEIDAPAASVATVRLTNAGHELLELSAVEARWREAKWVVGERTGTQSLTVIRSVLARWAYEAATHGTYWRGRQAAPYYPRTIDGRRPADHEIDRVRSTSFARRPYSYLERFDWRPGFDWRDAAERDMYYRSFDPLEEGATLPTHVV